MQRFSAPMVAAMLVILASLSMIGPFSIDTPLPAFERMGDDFRVESAQMQYVVSAYLFAFALMAPFHGPLSDALGRRPVMLGGLAVYGIASIGCALSPDLAVLLAFRVLQGLSAGAAVIVSRTVIRDFFDGPEAQRLMSRVVMVFSVAPAIAPIIGGLLLQVGSWHVIFWFMTGLALALGIAVALVLPESHPVELRTPVAVGSLLGSLVEVSRSGRFQRVVWASALTFGGQFLYIGGAAIFVVDLLGQGEQDFWMFFVPMVGGLMFGAWVGGRAAGRISPRRLVTLALGFSTFGATVNVVLGFLPTAEVVPLAVLGPALIAVGTGASYPVMQLILLDFFPLRRGAVVSMFTFTTLGLNALTASLLVPIVSVSIGVWAAAAAVLVVMGYVLWWWQLRWESDQAQKVEITST